MGKFVFWGAGEYGTKLLKAIDPSRVRCFCDAKKAGTVIDGKKVIAFRDLQSMEADYILVIAVDHPKYVAEIREQAGHLPVPILLAPQLLLQEHILDLRFYPTVIRSFLQTYGFTRLVDPSEQEKQEMDVLLKRFKKFKICSLQTSNISVFCYSFAEFCKEMAEENDIETFYCMARDGDFSRPLRKDLYLTYNLPNRYAFEKFSEKIFLLNEKNILFYSYLFCLHYDRVEIFDYEKLQEKCVVQGRNFLHGNGTWNPTQPTIHLSADECKHGNELSRKMGIKRKFVCFFARDNRYFQSTNKNLPAHALDVEDAYRNSDVQQFDFMAKELDELGIDAVRMGSMVERQYLGTGIDYSNLGQSDFMDLYLFSKCLFFIGDSSGIGAIPKVLFGKPVVSVVSPHVLLYRGDLVTPRDLLLPRRMYDPQKRKFLSLREILRLNKKYDFDVTVFEKAYIERGYRSISVSSEELWDISKEMLAIVQETQVYSSEDLFLRERYEKIITEYAQKDMRLVAVPGYIGAAWLKKNQWFLE